MTAASKEEVIDATIPNLTGNNWNDMSNPHNLGTMWKNKDGVWKLLKSLEDEEEENISKSGNSNDIWNNRNKRDQEKILAEIPELKPLLLELAKIQIESDKKSAIVVQKIFDLKSKVKDPNLKYNISMKIDYAIESLSSMENQFGYILPELKVNDDGEYSIS